MTPLTRALCRASVLALVAATPALAEDASQRRPDTPAPASDVLVVAQRDQGGIENAPATRASIDASTIAATVNAVSIEDTIKYLPSLLVRKRNIGDTQAPLATRTTGLGASARTLIYADGALLSALIGNNNTNASPRWSIVSPQEVERIDVLYGPFSAAYPGNSIGAVVNITTRLPDKLEATINAASNLQTFDQYGTHRTLPSYQFGATLGDRLGPIALFGSYDHVDSKAQPLLYVTAAANAASGGYPDVNRTGSAIRVLGASGIPHQVQDRLKLKAALDLGDARLTYVGSLFLNDMDAWVETYLTNAVTGQPAYTSAFSSGYYNLQQRHWSHSLSASGAAGRIDWQVIGTLFDFAKDIQRTPTDALPAAAAGGKGTITRLDGTGWQTLDAKASWRSDEAATHTLSAGAHVDRFELVSDRFDTADWIGGGQGALNLRSRGKTRTAALWAQDAWKIVPAVTLTVGGRYEWWRAYDGVNYSLSPAIDRVQPVRSAQRFSPKAALAWEPTEHWTARLSFGEAWRFPTVGELYQTVTTPVPAVPDPNLKPERALSEELAVERHDGHGNVRLSLFNEIVRDALVSQTGALNGTTTLATFVQNVDRTRARGVEAAVQRTNVVPRVDLTGSVTYADGTTRADAAFPAAVGKRLPQVPEWKATLVGTWRPVDGISLTAAGRYASRLYGTLDNSDVVGNTYQGFYKYLVVDLRAEFRAGEHLTLGLGVDNVNNDRYFLFHPFPQRSFQADVRWRL